MNSFELVDAIHALAKDPHLARVFNRDDLARLQSYVPITWRLMILEESEEGIVVTYKDNGRAPRPHI